MPAFAAGGSGFVVATEKTQAGATAIPCVARILIELVPAGAPSDSISDRPGTADKAGIEVFTIVKVTSRSSNDGEGEDGHGSEEDSSELDLNHDYIVWG